MWFVFDPRWRTGASQTVAVVLSSQGFVAGAVVVLREILARPVEETTCLSRSVWSWFSGYDVHAEGGGRCMGVRLRSLMVER